MQRIKFFTALAVRPFALLWLGQTVSRLGDFLYQVALAWWVVEKTGSSTVMGIVLLCSLLPTLVFGLLGGVVGDRLPRVPTLLTSDLLRGLIATLVMALAAIDYLEVWHILVASIVFGLVDAFFQPAYTALIPEVTPPDVLPSANALTSFGVQAGRIFGPLIGAGIIATQGTAVAFGVDAATFFVAALFLAPLTRLSLPRPTAAAESSLLVDIRSGIATVLGIPWLWITMSMLALTNITLAGPYQIALPFLVNEHFNADVRVLGWLYAAFPVGYLIGGLWGGSQTRIRARGWTVYGAMIVAGLGMFVLGLPVGLAVILLAAVLNGMALEIISLIWINTLQELVPNEQLGRISSIDMVGTYSLIPIGLALAGWGTNTFSAATVCLVGGGVTAAIAALGLVHPAIRAVD